MWHYDLYVCNNNNNSLPSLAMPPSLPNSSNSHHNVVINLVLMTIHIHHTAQCPQSIKKYDEKEKQKTRVWLVWS